MNDAGGVRGNECGSDLDCDVEYLDQLQTLAAHVLPEGDAFDELSRDESVLVGATDFIDSEDVWMIESGRGFRFLNEAV